MLYIQTYAYIYLWQSARSPSLPYACIHMSAYTHIHILCQAEQRTRKSFAFFLHIILHAQ